jgi:hypothetical protein
MNHPDIDIDMKNRADILPFIPHIGAIRDDQIVHPTGIYVQPIPYNPLTNKSTIPYKQAAYRGYFKIDLLNLHIYNKVENEQHLISLMNTTPPWHLLLDQSFSDLIFQLNGHSATLQQMKPSSIIELAAVLAMIRPAKQYLIGKPWHTIFEEVWTPPQNNNEYFFKKAHAVSYAVATVVHMNLIHDELTGSNASLLASPLNCPNSLSAP